MATSKTRTFTAKTCTDAVKQLRGLTTYDSRFKRTGQPQITNANNQWTVKATLTWDIGADNITVTLPDWTDIPDDADCKAAWQDAVNRLSVHEDGHVKNCETLATGLSTLLSGATTDFSESDKDKAKAIKQFTDKVDAETKRLKDEYDRQKKETDDANKQYDNVTTNGQQPGGSNDKWSPKGAKPVVMNCGKCP